MEDYRSRDYPGQLLPPLPPKPRPKRARTPINKGQDRSAGYVSRPYQAGRAPVSVQQQPRDRWGRWVKMFLSPRATGPRSLSRVPKKKLSRKSKSWGDRGRVGKFIGLFTGEWIKWRRKQLKKAAKRSSRSMGLR